MKHTTAETFVINMRMLLNETGMSLQELSRRAGVSKRMLDYILSGERKPSVELAGNVAHAFGITGWQMIMPGLKSDLLKNGRLDNLIKNYSHCPEAAQDYISMVAERDAEYVANKNGTDQ